jgi:hypothetical protein
MESEENSKDLSEEVEGYFPSGRSAPEGRSSQGKPIAPCWVLFRCPKCGYEVFEDIFGGPVSCTVPSGPKQHPLVWMKPITIVTMGDKDETNAKSDPDGDSAGDSQT